MKGTPITEYYMNGYGFRITNTLYMNGYGFRITNTLYVNGYSFRITNTLYMNRYGFHDGGIYEWWYFQTPAAKCLPYPMLP